MVCWKQVYDDGYATYTEPLVAKLGATFATDGAPLGAF